MKQSSRLLIAVILFPALQHVSISPPTAFNRAEAVAEFSRHRFELIVDVTHPALHWQCGDRHEVKLYLMKGNCGHRIDMPDSLRAKVAEMQKAATMIDSEAREISLRNTELFMNSLAEMGFN